MWFDTPAVMMLPGIDEEVLSKLQINNLGDLQQLVKALRAQPAATETLLSNIVGKTLVREWIQVT